MALVVYCHSDMSRIRKKGLWEPDKSWSKVGHKSNVGSILLISHTCSLEKVIDLQFTAYHIC